METFAPMYVEDYQSSYERHWYKIYRDEGHYVSTLMSPCSSFDKPRFRREGSLIEDTAKDSLREAIRAGIQKAKRKATVFDRLMRRFPDEPPDKLEGTADFVVDRHRANLYLKRKRFKRKAFLNDWNYFVTVTYSDKIWKDEDAFRMSLNRCFSNLAFRRGWRFMGVWERGELGERLHFHCLLYVPDGEMVGELYDDERWSTKRGKRERTQLNSFFGDRFGRTEFSDLDESKLLDSVKYITKYLEKNEEKVRYSRGICSEICAELVEREHIVLTFDGGSCVRGVCLDDALDWDTYIREYDRKTEERVRAYLRVYGSGPKVHKTADPPPEISAQEAAVLASLRDQTVRSDPKSYQYVCV